MEWRGLRGNIQLGMYVVQCTVYIIQLHVHCTLYNYMVVYAQYIWGFVSLWLLSWQPIYLASRISCILTAVRICWSRWIVKKSESWSKNKNKSWISNMERVCFGYFDTHRSCDVVKWFRHRWNIAKYFVLKILLKSNKR